MNNQTRNNLRNNNSPFYFFFSYARKDLNKYLERFFNDLAEEVSDLAGCNLEEVSFRDLENLEPGDNWKKEVAEALRSSLVLVAIYTKRYFYRPYCAKEIKIFLDRGKANGIGEDVPEKIIPILWVKKKWLNQYNLPPDVISHIHYEHRNYPSVYTQDGLKNMILKRGVTYRRFLEIVAQRIIRLAEDEPVRPLKELPDLAKIKDIFQELHQTTHQADANIGEGPRIVQFTFIVGTAQELGRIRKDSESCYGKNTSHQWRPFCTASKDIRTLIEKVLDEGFDFKEIPADKKLQTNLKSASKKNIISLLIVDPWSLEIDSFKNMFMNLLSNKDLDAEILIIFDKQDRKSVQRINKLDEKLKLHEVMKNKIIKVIGSEKELEENLLATLNEIRKKIVEKLPVPRQTDKEEWPKKPSIKGPGGEL